MANVVNWFEIPAADFNRAVEFYGNILSVQLEKQEMMGQEMGFFPYDPQSGAVSGCVVKGEGYVPSDKGSVVYLNGGNDLQGILSKVETAGGKVLLPKTAIGENGFIAHFLDSEGNRVALHSMN